MFVNAHYYSNLGLRSSLL